MKYKLKTPSLSLSYGTETVLSAVDGAVPPPKVLSVSEITRNIRSLLESNLSGVWVEGEISNFKSHSSGHRYFSLKDENAQIACVMFRDNRCDFEPKDGMQVVCAGRVSVYAVRGQYQLYVDRIEPKGLGALQLRFQELKEKLKREGLFEEARKRPIPFLPAKIAVVTSADGAALRDILHVLSRRFPGAHVLIYPVPVQGAPAAPAIAGAIEDLNREKAADVMILARGGGSLEDLWAFNEEAVARAIFASRIPVISAVGHETDFTIADFVCDRRAPTPSAAAEIVLPLQQELIARIAELKVRSAQSIEALLDEARERLRMLRQRRSLRDPLAVFEALFQRLDESARRLGGVFRRLVALKRQQAALFAEKLEALGPLSTLRRGFSVSMRPDGTLLRSVRSVKTGDEVRTKLKDGSFRSRVTEVENG